MYAPCANACIAVRFHQLKLYSCRCIYIAESLVTPRRTVCIFIYSYYIYRSFAASVATSFPARARATRGFVLAHRQRRRWENYGGVCLLESCVTSIFHLVSRPRCAALYLAALVLRLLFARRSKAIRILIRSAQLSRGSENKQRVASVFHHVFKINAIIYIPTYSSFLAMSEIKQ